MSDTTENIEFQGEQILNKSKTRPLRERMEGFIEQQETVDPKRLRETVADGDDRSTIVIEDREERL